MNKNIKQIKSNIYELFFFFTMLSKAILNLNLHYFLIMLKYNKFIIQYMLKCYQIC